MIYTKLTKEAMKIAYNAHHGQTDKNGMPYIFHPIHLAEQMNNEETICTALLHDVIEDTDVTLEKLELRGFSKSILDALKLLAHDEAEPYMDYIEKIKGNQIAKCV